MCYYSLCDSSVEYISNILRTNKIHQDSRNQMKNTNQSSFLWIRYSDQNDRSSCVRWSV